MHHRVLPILLVATLLWGSLAGPARAQSGPALDDLIAHWAAGSFRSPLLCELDGQLVRGVRRVLIRARPQPGRPPVIFAEFVDLEPGTATRCIDATGAPVPNLVGRLELRRSGHRHPETAARDFKRSLKQDRGFTYSISQGSLRIQEVRQPPAEPRLVDLQGGSLVLSLIFPATDASRALADFSSSRKLLLTLESGEGERIVLPLFDPAAAPR